MQLWPLVFGVSTIQDIYVYCAVMGAVTIFVLTALFGVLLLGFCLEEYIKDKV